MFISGSATSTGSLGQVQTNLAIIGDQNGYPILKGASGVTDLFIGGDVSNVQILTAHLLPGADSNRDLGSATRRWQDGFFTNIHGTTLISGSATSTGSFAKLELTSNITGSDVFTVDGLNGRLFTVTDEMSGSIFSANLISGLPVIEAFSDNRVNIGPFSSPIQIDSSGNISGSSTSTGSFGRVEASNISGTNTGDVTLAGSYDYITISNQVITRNQVNLTTDVTGTLPVANGGTGATSLNNLITLGTHTTGNYVASLVAGTGIDLANNSGETATPTVSVDVSDFMTNGLDNRVLTATGTDAMNAEANLTFNGSTLSVSSKIKVDEVEGNSNPTNTLLLNDDQTAASNMVTLQSINHINLMTDGNNNGVGSFKVLNGSYDVDTADLALEINSSGNASFSGDVSAANGFYPDADNGAQLGNESLRFSDVFAVQTTTGGVFETGLKTEKIGENPTGTIVSWRGDGLVPCDSNEDELVMGVIKEGKDEPIVMGAEPVLVTGKVEVGDYIVTSDKIGHGKSVKRGYLLKKDLFGKVIAQALESCDGDSNLIKCMIRKM